MNKIKDFIVKHKPYIIGVGIGLAIAIVYCIVF